MYKNIEIETSYKYLSKVISKLKEPICILGGWAVFFAVKDNYQKNTGRIQNPKRIHKDFWIKGC